MKRRNFLVSVPAMVSMPTSASAQTSIAPIWSANTTFSIEQGKTYALTTLCTDPHGLRLIFSALSTLPYGVVLDQSTGALSVGNLTAAGSYNMRFRAFNGMVAADSPFLTLSVTAIPVVSEPPPSSPPTTTTGTIKVTLVRDAIPAYKFRTGSNALSTSQAWHSARARADGTIITWGSAAHDGNGDNSVRVLDPVKRTHTKFPESIDGGVNQYPVGQHDNLNYFVITSEDKLVICDRGVYDLTNRTAGFNGWTHGTITNTKYWANGPHLTGLDDDDFWLPNQASTGGISGADSDLATGKFNAGVCYLPALDKAILFGGGVGGTVNIDRIWLIERNDASSRFHVPGKAHKWRLAGIQIDKDARFVVGGVNPLRHYALEMRDMICAVGRHVYFVSPKTGRDTFDPRGWRPWFWRLDVKSLSETGDPKLMQLPDLPQKYASGALKTGALPQSIMINGVVSVEPDRWEIQSTPAPAVHFPAPSDAVNFMLQDAAGSRWACVRSSDRTKMYATKVPWLTSASEPVKGAGYYQQWETGARFGCMTYDESAGYIVFTQGHIGVWAYDPESTTQGWIKLADPGKGYRDGPFPNIVYSKATKKNYLRCAGDHSSYWSTIEILTKKPRQRAQYFQTITDPRSGELKDYNFLFTNKHYRVVNSRGRLWLLSGDHAGYPFVDSNVAPGYPDLVAGRTWRGDGARQDYWMADLAPLASGKKIVWELAQNWWADYPFVQGQPPKGFQRGPLNPDGSAVTVDKRGDFWVGPIGRYAGEYQKQTKDPVYDMKGEAGHFIYRWRMPPKHSDGVRLGGSSDGSYGHWKPNDLDLVSGLSPGLLYSNRASAENSWSTYDPVRDEVILLSFSSNQIATINIYRLNVGPKSDWKWKIQQFPSNWSSVIPSLYPSGVTAHSKNVGLFGEICVIDRNLYALVNTQAFGPAYQYTATTTSTGYLRAAIAKINLDTLSVSWIKLPTFYARGLDVPTSIGPDPYINAIGTSVQYRGLVAVNRKLVLGPSAITNFTRQDADPILYIYDIDAKAWTAGEPFNRSLNPDGSPLRSAWGCLAAVPELNEVWIMQTGTHAFSTPPIPHIRYRID